MAEFWRLLRGLPLALLAPLFSAASLFLLALTDLAWAIFGRRRAPNDQRPNATSATVVIPNWNGRDLLERYLPSVIRALEGNPANEVLVVDNGSTDGSADFIREAFPGVRLLALEQNLGFGGGSNAGFRAASNDIVVLLNSDMRVAPDFLQPLLDGFDAPSVFAVSCQIFFTDPKKLREETGLTQAWWAQGTLRVRHRLDDAVDRLFPCFYGGGGSCAFDRRKFLELGGFDHLLAPFYLEDTDLGYLAWKRGWRVLYAPQSHVWHEHRGTIGRKFSTAYIESVLQKNFLLFVWKNIHTPAMLLEHFLYALTGAWLSWIGGESRERCSPAGLMRAFLQLPAAMRARWRSRSLSVVSDAEAFRRPLGGYYRDRFQPERIGSGSALRVLFVSPYSISPPVHGGAVFMHQTVRQLGRRTDLHLVTLVDSPHEIPEHQDLEPYCRSQQFIVRMDGQPKGLGSIDPFAVREFANRDLEWLLHRQIYLRDLDVLQLEYAQMAQYALRAKRLAVALFEHDVYFQSIGSRLKSMTGAVSRVKASFEYLRALRYELRTLPHIDLVQTCTADNRDYLLSFLPELRGRIREDLRAGIDTSQYDFREDGREPSTVLFLGSFRHTPNLEALRWFLREVMPLLVARHPQVRLMVAGSDPPPVYTLPYQGSEVQLLGFIPDAKEALARYSVFACPILSGSGVRVKLLEAFAAGIPAVSTRIGAEGLIRPDQETCLVADDPAGFAASIADLLENPDRARRLARGARDYVTRHRNIAAMTDALVEAYRQTLRHKQSAQ